MSTWYLAAKAAHEAEQAEARAAVLVALDVSMKDEAAEAYGVALSRASSYHDTLCCEQCGTRIMAGEVFCPNGCHKAEPETSGFLYTGALDL